MSRCTVDATNLDDRDLRRQIDPERPRSIRETADELLERVGLSRRADDLPVTFSRELKQKAAICFAFDG